jgi:hypothetical protein
MDLNSFVTELRKFAQKLQEIGKFCNVGLYHYEILSFLVYF